MEKPILWHFRFTVLFLELYKLSRAHPQVVDMPSFEYISEVLPEKETLESAILVNNVDPSAMINVGNELKCLPKRSAFLY